MFYICLYRENVKKSCLKQQGLKVASRIGPLQDCSNNVPVIKNGPAPGATRFTYAYIGKT